MNKNMVLKTLQEVAKEHGFEITLMEADELIKVFTETYVAIGEEIEVGDKANVGAVVVEKKQTKPRKGTSTLGDKEVDWEVPAKIIIDLKAKTSFKKEHEIEIS
ncbi:hypothetical protein [Peptostreptococcus porci]|uniref:hypothetical protein n=1 Tax=Peptostreptococcus porci TaxID=2652282 RepID=UPI002A80813B|nr:hypothetical protein [Peptostreptococcus porci]MDY4127624.1 hypothetical protein [Peptostreptococcus porci]